MVAMFEVAFLILFVALGVWWLRRTKLYRSQRRSSVDRVQDARGSGADGGGMNGLYGGGDPGQ